MKNKVKKQKKKTKQKTKAKSKTKILAIGDFHGDKEFANKIAKQARKEKVDIIILAGDLTFAEHSTDDVIGPFVKTKKPVLLIPGNHESALTVDFLARKYQARNLHGYYYIKNKTGIFGAGGAEIGPFPTTEEEIAKLLKKSHDRVKNLDKTVMVTHIHPSGTIMEKLCLLPPSKAVRKAIEKFQPDVAVNSHSHESAGLEDKIGKTRVINVARKPVVFEV